MTSAATAVGGLSPAARSPWFFSAPYDLLLILCVPFFTWPLLMAAQEAWGAGLLKQLILLTASGHYFATFVRAYGDRELFARFRTRLLFTPVLLLALASVMNATGNQSALVLMTAMWAFWHWLAQAFGFARIYDSKVGSFRPWTARLDKALVITGFVATVTLNDNSTALFSKLFLDVGIALPSGESFKVLQGMVYAMVVVVGFAYAANLAWTIASGQPWSWQKQFMHVTTIGYYWFAFSYVPNVLIAHVLYEFFHDVQYFAITWRSCRARVGRPGTTGWMSWMFRPGLLAPVGFVGIMVAFGAVDMFGRRINTEGWIYDWTTQVFLVAALLHYYYDGFIWKARESSIGKDLGIASGLGSTMVPGALHAARWGLFLVPLFVLPAVGGQQFSEVERAEMLVGVAPSDFLSRSQLAFECLKAERIEEAAVHCEASIAANPGYAPVRSYYGVTLELLRRPEEAKAQYRVALDCPDLGGAHLRAATNLGVLLLLEGKREAARASLDAAAKIGGQGPMQRLYNLARRPEGGPERRMQVYRVLLEQYPQQLDALYELGTLQYEANLLSEAQQSFSRLVQQVPGSAAALVGLAKVQIAMADYGPARASLQQALQTEPGNAEAAALLRKIGG